MNTGMEDKRMNGAKRKLSGLQKSPVKTQKQPRGKKGIVKAISCYKILTNMRVEILDKVE